MLLTRNAFRESVLKRDNYKCIICKKPAKDAHHIMERRLWDDGGYYLDNGSSLCEVCHIKAEKTIISCEEIRDILKIKTHIPSYLYDDNTYDKWGNIILPNGNRLKGELFYDESVQKILKGSLHLFSKYVKYPRTFHLPWSGFVSEDDRVLSDTKHFEGKLVMVSVKMDGEQTTMYNNYIHARSLDSRSHPSRTWVKNLHGMISFNIPEEWRICGENLYAKHTIHYQNLLDYFMVFSIWNEKNECLSWKETVEWSKLLGLKTVPVLWVGYWNEDKIKNSYINMYNGDRCEGYVVRLVDSFNYGSFRKSVAKYVHNDFREDVKNRHNWMYQKTILNKIGVNNNVESQ